MTVSAMWSVFCQGGAKPCHGWIAEEDSKRLARRVAATNGWVRREVDGRIIDLCPACFNHLSRSFLS